MEHQSTWFLSGMLTILAASSGQPMHIAAQSTADLTPAYVAKAYVASSSTIEEPSLSPFERRQRRLNISGWSLIGIGVAFPTIMAPLISKREKEHCEVLECPMYGFAVTSYLLGPSLVIIGTSVLLRRRGLRKEHERGRELAISPSPTGLSLSGTF